MNKYRENKYAKTYDTTTMDWDDLYVLMWKRYFDFEGLSSRREYWIPYIITILVNIALQVFIEITFDPTLLGLLAIIYVVFAIGVIIPSYSLMVRRLHDTGESGWNILWAFTFIGAFYLIYLLARESR
jgi:uncharacterized membrane protein YhaH (DUF805 family)